MNCNINPSGTALAGCPGANGIACASAQLLVVAPAAAAAAAVLSGSPVMASRELRHLPFGLGKGKGKGAPAPAPVSLTAE